MTAACSVRAKPAAAEAARIPKMVGGNQGTESFWGVTKNTLRRQNKLGRSSVKSEHVDLFAAAFVRRSPGFELVIRACAEYRRACVGQLPPRAAFKNTDFFRSLEKELNSCPAVVDAVS